ncbi:uncharacterized protein [Chelonus insularis]|uniref:uncharacterized protein n=1 Tax=Chelonus insularis TaxID=460826 RepID=UPI00158EB64A|nr:uncharacterized protein LOC118072121 [Chelonus insularis]
MKLNCLLLTFVLTISHHFGATEVIIEEENTPGKKFFLSLPEEEREDFLVFSLGDGYLRNSSKVSRNPDFPFPDALGIDEDLLRKFQSLEAPQNFTTNLYALIKSKYNLDHQDLRELILRREVCFPNRKCLDMGDVGSLCCPF